MIQESDGLHDQRKLLTFQLEKLGVKEEQIRGAMEELGERPFCRTLELEKQDEEEAKKRKLEQEAEERESKRAKVIPTVKGVEAHDYITPFKDPETEDYDEKLKSQLKALLRSQEIVIQQQEKAFLQQQHTINQQ